jgi:hypothetical protein
MKEYHKCLETYEKGLKLDPENAELQEGLSKTLRSINVGTDEKSQVCTPIFLPHLFSFLPFLLLFLFSFFLFSLFFLFSSLLFFSLFLRLTQMFQAERAAKAMQDPEIQEILRDPVMQQILSDLQTDPKSANTHLRNPMVANKLQKLIAAGVLKTG